MLDDAFGSDRKSRTAYSLREGLVALPDLSFAAVSETRALTGTIQCWPVALEHPCGLAPLVLVGPVAVAPDVQRGGIGRKLVEASLAAAQALGHDALMMIGDPEYYQRFFGFSADHTGGWQLPGPFDPRRLLAKITRPGGVPSTGCIIPDPAFATRDGSA